ncbi:MAG: anti-anti-sigma factor [Gammaproteobacteria bacterium]|nr:MAG: anti-anti-sigma factor [Gammaproteobacteria bacterium]RLA22854.1 MAG: anti-anti-sigma factor [Gammaproteobacteria bacterium]
MPISAVCSNNGQEAVIKIAGRFDFGEHQAFKTACDACTTAQKYTLDLRATEYVDSSALGMLLILRDKVGGDKGRVKILNASPEVKKVLTIANFEKLFTVI